NLFLDPRLPWRSHFHLVTKKLNIWCRNPGGDRAPATARRLSPPPSDWDSALFLCWGHRTPCGECSLVSDPLPGRPVLIAAVSGQTLLRHLVAPRFRGVKETKFDSKTPLGCLLANLRTLELDQDLRRQCLIHYCTVAWPQYRLNNQSQWPPEGTFDYQILTDLDNLCRRQGKWSEVPYVQAFWTLRSRPELCSSCSTSQVLLARSPPRTLPHSTSRDSNLAPPSPLAEPPEDLSRPPVRAPHLSPPPYQPAPQQPVSPTPSISDTPGPGPASSVPSPTVPLLPAPEPQPPSSPLPSPPISARTRSKNSSPDLVCPLREVAGAEGVVRVHAPFSLQDLSQIEKRLGSFSANPDNYIKEFQYLAQAYDLTWHDLHVIQTTTLTIEERERIQAAARGHADQVHLTDATMPVGAQAVPVEPGWDYQDGQDGRRRRDHVVRCPIAGVRAASNKAVNYDKIREIIQAPDENPAIFLNRLTEALIQYTRLDPACPAGATVLATHFISQSAPDIRKKLKKVEEGPQTPISDLVRMAFKVFNSREEAAELKRQARLQQKVQLQTQALVAALRPRLQEPAERGTHPHPSGACFKGGLKAIGPVSAPPRGHQPDHALSAI
uniref:Core shell protein Gag P30 domain-containing protein n=1 Tax=Canis lupus familiaris TaxID=9615 RepID=A0A8C0SMT2_CANLF